MSGRELYVAKQAANFDYNGQPIFVTRGTTVRAGHPLMAGHEDLFEPLKVDYEVDEAKPVSRETTDDSAPRSQSRADQQGARTR